MDSIKRTLAALGLALAAMACAAAKTAVYNGSEYSLFVTYNDEVQQGDAVFVRMTYTASARQRKKSQAEFEAVMKILNGSKSLGKEDFYALDTRNRSQTEMLCGIAISSWQKAGDYAIEVGYRIPQGDQMKFTLPLKVLERDFDRETIPLNTRNTSVRTDYGSKRMDQINRLNAILRSVNKDSVFGTSAFAKPVLSERMTAHFGDRRVYAYSTGKTSTTEHYGNDYGVPTGTEVRACADGRVVMAEDRVSTGLSVVIEHLPGLYSLYYHQSSLKVKEGQMVKKGDLIGLSGATGLATGPHLHWEMRLNSMAVRPEFFMGNFAFD